MKNLTEKLAPSLFLNKLELNVANQKKEATPINHILICDVSYSMDNSLPKIRTQLKNKIPSLVKDDGSTISIIWFSGNSQAGILQQGIKVNNLLDLQKLNDSIDKFLKPVGATAFKKPLEITKGLISDLLKENPNNLNSMIFLTDGYNNDCKWQEVMDILTELENDLHHACFVEYGYYADSKALNTMAEAVGGVTIQSDGFEKWEADFESIITNSAPANKVKLDITDLKNNLVVPILFTLNNGEVVSYSTRYKNEILIADSTTELYYLTTKSDNEEVLVSSEQELYICAYVLMDRMKYDELDKILECLGDVGLFKKVMGAFGKQKLNEVKLYLKGCINDASLRYPEGKDYKFVPKKNAFCVFDLLEVLSEDGNFFMTDHEDFNYSKIGATRLQKVSMSEEQKTALANAKSLNEVKKITKEIEFPEFETNPNQIFPLTDFVWNENRANLSVRVRYEGKVKLPKNEFKLESIDSYIFRTYTIIKDGILNLSTLPVILSFDSFKKLQKEGFFENEVFTENKIYKLDFSHLPIINKMMVENISAKQLAMAEYDLIKLQSEQKVCKYYNEKVNPKTSATYVAKYTKECAEWLKSIGVTDYNGFAPLTEKGEVNDNYVAIELLTKIKGLSSIPKVEDVIKKLKDPKAKPVTISESLLKPMVEFLEAPNQKVDAESLNKFTKETIKKKRELMNVIAGVKFSLILSKRWFKEFKDFDENTLQLDVDGGIKEVKFEFNEKLVEI